MRKTNQQSFHRRDHCKVIYKCPSNSLFIMFHSLMLVMKGGRLLFLYYQVFTMIVVPMSFKKKKLNCEISPSFPLRLKLAQINWNSATNKEDEFSHQM